MCARRTFAQLGLVFQLRSFLEWETIVIVTRTFTPHGWIIEISFTQDHLEMTASATCSGLHINGTVLIFPYNFYVVGAAFITCFCFLGAIQRVAWLRTWISIRQLALSRICPSGVYKEKAFIKRYLFSAEGHILCS